jgi:hypothetical protein
MLRPDLPVPELSSTPQHEFRVASTFAVEDERNQWLIDSGASVTVCHQPDMLTNIRRAPKMRVRVANDTVCESNFVGDIPFASPGGSSITIKARLVPKLRRNLISVSALCALGYEVSFSGVSCG